MTTKEIEIDKAFVAAADTVLSGLTKGKLTSMVDLLELVRDSSGLRDETDRLKGELANANARVAALAERAATTATPIVFEVPTKGGAIGYKTTTRNVADLFTIKGKPIPGLNFEMTLPEWDAPNPLVPKIDEHYKFDTVKLVKALTALRFGERVIGTGDTGTGKTEFMAQIAARLGLEFHRVNLDGQTSRVELVGKDSLVYEDGKQVTKFVEGTIPAAIQRPAILCLDEADRTDPMLSGVLFRVTEGAGFLLSEDGNRFIPQNPLARIVATANTSLSGDESGVYQGTRAQPIALKDRFSCWIKFDYMAEGAEAAVIRAKVPGTDENFSLLITKIANAIRQSFRKNTILDLVSLRGLTAAAKYRASFIAAGGDPVQAARTALEMTVIDRMSGSDAQQVREIVDRFVKEMK